MFMRTLCWVVVAGHLFGCGGRGSHVRTIEKPAVGETFTVSEGPALPAGRGSHAGGTVAGHVVIAGGTAWNAERTVKQWLGDTLVFAGGNWSPGPALPHAVSEPMFASDESGLYVAGGRQGAAVTNDGVYRLADAGGNLAWTPLAKLPMTWTAGAGGIVDGRFVVTCGSTNNAPTNQTWALDVRARGAAWRQCKPLPGPARMYPAMVACGKFLYLFGGMRPTEESGTRGMQVFKDAYRYDPKADAWERLPDLPAKGYCWAASAIDEKSLLLTGRADGAIHDDLWRVNVNEMRVLSAGRTVIQTTCAPLARVDANTWWLVGGEPDSNKTRTPRVTVITRIGGVKGQPPF